MRADGSVENRVEQIGADLARAQDARARARGPGDRALAAQPRRRAAHGQAARALGPARVGRDRAGRRPRDVHLPRRVLRPGVRARGDRGPDHLQAPQRRPGDGRADLPEGVPALHVLRRRGPRTSGRCLPRRPLRRLRLPLRRGRADRPGVLAAGRSGSRARRRPRSRAGIPKRFRDVSFDREPVPSIARRAPDVVRDVRRYVAHDRPSSSPRAAACGSRATSAPARRRWRCSCRKAAMEADHTVAIYSLPRLLGMLRDTYDDDAAYSLNDLHRPALRRRPAAHRRRRRRADVARGCSSSSTRSSTRATRTAGRSC